MNLDENLFLFALGSNAFIHHANFCPTSPPTSGRQLVGFGLSCHSFFGHFACLSVHGFLQCRTCFLHWRHCLLSGESKRTKLERDASPLSEKVPRLPAVPTNIIHQNLHRRHNQQIPFLQKTPRPHTENSPKGRGAKISRFFPPSRPIFVFSSLSLEVFSWNGGLGSPMNHPNCAFGLRGHSVGIFLFFV